MSGYFGQSSSSSIGVQSPSNASSTINAISTSGSTGQLAVTASAQALGSTTNFANGFILTNLSSSAQSVFIGFSSGVTTSTGFELAIGASVTLPIANIALIYVIASTTGSTVAYLGCN